MGLNGTNHCWVEGEARMYVDDDRYHLYIIQAQRTILVVPMRLEMTGNTLNIKLIVHCTAECILSWDKIRKDIIRSKGLCYTDFILQIPYTLRKISV